MSNDNVVLTRWQVILQALSLSHPIIPIHFGQPLSGVVRVVLSSSEDLTCGLSTRVALGDNKEYSFADLFSLTGASLGD